MKIQLTLVLFILAAHAIAGGIRRPYELLALWYTYQARIAELMIIDGKLDKLDVLRAGYGTRPDGTMYFNEMLKYVDSLRNLPTTNVAKENLAPNLDSTARWMFDHQDDPNLELKANWADGNIGNWRIMAGVNNYLDLMPQIGRMIRSMADRKRLGANDQNLRQARSAVDKSALARKLEFEKFRWEVLKDAPEFTGSNKVDWVRGDVRTMYGEEDMKDLWSEQTFIKYFQTRPTLRQEFDAWEKRYYKDQTPDPKLGKELGRLRRGHLNALQAVETAQRIIVTGLC